MEYCNFELNSITQALLSKTSGHLLVSGAEVKIPSANTTVSIYYELPLICMIREPVIPDCLVTRAIETGRLVTERVIGNKEGYYMFTG